MSQGSGDPQGEAGLESARPADLPGILTLLEACGLPGDGLGDHLGSALVARQAGRIVGSAALEVYGDAALLRSVAVAPERRGTGLGQALARGALDLARSRGVRVAYLLTETAAGFFPRLGFAAVDRSAVPASVRGSVEFVSACPETAVAMRADL